MRQGSWRDNTFVIVWLWRCQPGRRKTSGSRRPIPLTADWNKGISARRQFTGRNYKQSATRKGKDRNRRKHLNVVSPVMRVWRPVNLPCRRFTNFRGNRKRKTAYEKLIRDWTGERPLLQGSCQYFWQAEIRLLLRLEWSLDQTGQNRWCSTEGRTHVIMFVDAVPGALHFLDGHLDERRLYDWLGRE